MLRKCLFAVVAVLATATVAQATAVITMGDHVLQPDTPGQIVPVFVRSDNQDRAQGIDFAFAIGRGGPEISGIGLPAGPDGPVFQATNYTQGATFFAPNNDDPSDIPTLDGVNGNYPQVFFGGTTTDHDDILIPDTDTLLMELIIDTTGFAEGNWLLEGPADLGFTTAMLNVDIPFPTELVQGSITIEGGSSGFLGDSETNPILPDDEAADGTWIFTDVPNHDGIEQDPGHWYDPPPADGYEYTSTGGTNFVAVGMPSLAAVPDQDGMYKVRLGDGTVMNVASGGVWNFPSPQTSFRVSGIISPVDGGDPAAFPTFIQFDGLVNSFTMNPLPEPSTLVLAGIALIGLVGFGRRRKA